MINSKILAIPYSARANGYAVSEEYMDIMFEWNGKKRTIYMVSYSYPVENSWYYNEYIEVIGFGATIDDWNALRHFFGKDTTMVSAIGL